VTHGLYVPSAVDGAYNDARAWQEVLPRDGVFSHLTAARLHGWWLPPLPDETPLWCALPQSGPRLRRKGLRVARHPKPSPSVELVGLRVATPAETLLACAADLHLLDLVVLLDAALHRGSCTRAEVASAAAARRRGAPLLRRALHLADGRAESAWEVLLRVLHVACDVPVEPQHEVRHDGVLLGRGDLWIRGTRTLQEYDGGGHRDPSQHRDDLRRDRRLAERGWQRHGYTSSDLTSRAVTVLRDADRALDREHRPERIRAWHEMLARSLFTPAGTSRLRSRWRLDPAS